MLPPILSLSLSLSLSHSLLLYLPVFHYFAPTCVDLVSLTFRPLRLYTVIFDLATQFLAK